MEERKSLSKLSNTQVQINVAAKVKENLKTFKTGANDVVVVRQANANASYKATPLHIRYDWTYIEAKKKAIDIQILSNIINLTLRNLACILLLIIIGSENYPAGPNQCNPKENMHSQNKVLEKLVVL